MTRLPQGVTQVGPDLSGLGPVVILAVLLSLLGYVLYRVLVVDPGRSNQRFAAEAEQWAQSGSYPAEIRRVYHGGSLATDDAQRMQAAGYAVGRIQIGRGGFAITWVRR